MKKELIIPDFGYLGYGANAAAMAFRKFTEALGMAKRNMALAHEWRRLAASLPERQPGRWRMPPESVLRKSRKTKRKR